MSDKACILCCRSTDDPLQYGEKFTCEGTTAHLYCLLLTSNLVQNGEDDDGISGFMPKDIKAEISRTKKLLCHYCRGKSATIGCCYKACRRSFHLPCALENDCRMEFTNTFRSYCDDHHDIKKPKNVHKSTDLCTICYDEMGEYNLIRSIPLPCCNKDSWCHKLCLQQYAQTSGYFLKCPLCKDSDMFRDWIAQRGVFIPDRDAKWEVDETGPNTFYGFEQHSERPSECEAKVCKCSRGRKYQVDLENNRHSLVYCQYCGSHAIHLGCAAGEEFLCDECTSIVARVRKNAASSLSTGSGREILRGGNSNGQNFNEIARNSEDRFGKYTSLEKALVAKYNLREFSILLRRLTPRDLGLKIKMKSESDTTDIINTTFTTETTETTDTSDTNARDSDSGGSQTDSSDGNVPIILSSELKILMSELEKKVEPELKPAKRTRIFARNQFFDSDSNSDLDMDAIPKFDINDNSRDIPSSNSKVNQKLTEPDGFSQQSGQTGMRARQLSSSDEEYEIKPNVTDIRKLLFSESSDDQMFGKENEQPSKNVAVVRPFSMIETSSDENVKPFKSKVRSVSFISSSDEFLKPSSLSECQITKTKHDITIMNGMARRSEIVTSSTKPSPVKRKRRTVLSYLRETSSSDDETYEPKRKRKSPKVKSRAPAKQELERGQSTIMNYFTKKFNQSQ